MNKSYIGVSLAIISALIYAIQTAVVKGLENGLSTPVVVFIQSIVCFILIIPFIFTRGLEQARRLVKTQNLKIQILRTLFSLGISYFLFSAVKFIPLADAVLLTNTAPLIMPFLGLAFMSQKINNRLWLPLLIGFAGIGLVLRPDSHVFQLPSLLCLGAALCMAASILLVRQASKTDAALTNAFYYFLLSLPVSAIMALFFWTPFNLHQLLIMLCIGSLFFIVQITLIYASKFVSAQTISSLYLLNIVFAALIGWIVWRFSLTSIMMCGMVLTIAGALLTIQAQGLKKQDQTIAEIAS